MLIHLLIVPFFFSADFSVVFVHTYIISMITLYVFSFLHENKKLQTWNVSPLLALEFLASLEMYAGSRPVVLRARPFDELLTIA